MVQGLAGRRLCRINKAFKDRDPSPLESTVSTCVAETPAFASDFRGIASIAAS